MKLDARSCLCAGLVGLLLLATAATSFASPDELRQIQRAIAERGLRWQAGETAVSVLNAEERATLLGFAKPFEAPAPRDDGQVCLSLPAAIDWRDNGGNFVTSAKNQLNCGSCWAFASLAAMESRMAILGNINDPTIDLSEQHLVSCTAGSCSAGGHYEIAYDYVQREGVPDEACFPYKAQELSCDQACNDWRERATFIESWTWIAGGGADIEAIKTALQRGPVPTTIEVYADFMYYTDGVYERTSDSYQGPHGVALVGYDDTLNAWIIKNSWGNGWGQDGFGYVGYGEASIGAYSAEPIVSTACPGCLIDSRCWMAGQANTANACQICKPTLAADAWTQLNDGEACNDGDSCNGTDSCYGGSCSLHSGDPCVDDGLFCNGAEFCNPSAGTCVSSGSPCGLGEECSEDSQECGPADSRDGDAADDDGGGCGG